MKYPVLAADIARFPSGRRESTRRSALLRKMIPNVSNFKSIRRVAPDFAHQPYREMYSRANAIGNIASRYKKNTRAREREREKGK